MKKLKKFKKIEKFSKFIFLPTFLAGKQH